MGKGDRMHNKLCGDALRGNSITNCEGEEEELPLAARGDIQSWGHLGGEAKSRG